MAYSTYYTANFTNEVEQDVVCLIQSNIGSPASVVNLPVVSMKISDRSDNQDIYSCVISKELDLTLWVDVNTTLSWETFVASNYEDWKITVTVDGEVFFVGFISPDEGSAPFQDKPYEINIKASDGIGLLKGIKLTKIDGTDFLGIFKLSDYLAAILYRTGLSLPIRAYCTYLNNYTLNKYDSMSIDLFNTVYVHSRTFLKSSDEYESCYDALKIILNGWCNIQQYQGRWQIMCLSDRQVTPTTLYYVDYNSAGTPTGGDFDVEGPAKVGRYELIYPSIYPINENQRIGARFANKQVKTIFNYEVPPYLIANETLKLLGPQISGLNGSYVDPKTQKTYYYKGYGLVGWGQYGGDPNTLSSYSGSKRAYIRVDRDAFESQRDRFYVIEADPSISTALGHSIRNDNLDFWVDEGDILSVSVTVRCKFQEGGGASDRLYFARLALLIDGKTGSNYNDWYTLQESGTWVKSPYGYLMQPNETIDETDWTVYSIEKTAVPASGKLFLYLGSGGVYDGNEAHFKDIKIEYTPFLRGSVLSTKGEYHLNKQNINFPDSYENEIKISDSPKRVIKGTFFKDNTGLPMDPRFYRFPNSSDNKNFKQLVNLGYYNHTYRRMYKVEGEFTSLMYNLIDDQEIRKPIGFHKLFRFADMSPQRDFVLIPSLEMDLVSGNIKATFAEVKGQYSDGSQTGDVDIFDYIF